MFNVDPPSHVVPDKGVNKELDDRGSPNHIIRSDGSNLTYIAMILYENLDRFRFMDSAPATLV